MTEKTVFILVYVEDIFLACKQMNILQEIADKIGCTFKIRIENSVKWFLRIAVERDEITKSIKIHNAPMVDELLVRLNISNNRRVSTLLRTKRRFSDQWALSSTEEQMEIKNKPYRQLIGTIIHPSNTVRPDIAFFG